MTASASRRLTLKLVVLAGVCYGAHYRFAPDDGSVIDVTAPLIDAVAERQESLLGRPLNASEREAATESYIEEEILVREAFRRGLDRNDRRVRPMLIDHARRELLRAAGYVPTELSPSELRAYFDEHADEYRIPERVDLLQVLLPPGTEPSSVDDVLTALRDGADFRQFGVAGPGASVKGVTRSDCAQAFGLDFATTVFAIDDDAWHGPIVTSAGTHFVRVPSRSPGRQQSYEEVAHYLEQDYMSDAERRVIDEELDRIRRRYRVEIEDVE